MTAAHEISSTDLAHHSINDEDERNVLDEQNQDSQFRQENVTEHQSINRRSQNNRERPSEQPANATLVMIRGSILQQVIGHPLYYGRSLIQMGYEPMPQVLGKTLFGKSAMFYPNMFQYLKYIYKIDGFLGLYRGFGCALSAKLVFSIVTNKVGKMTGVSETPEEKKQVATWNSVIKKTLQEVRCQSYGILLSHPFYVMTMRCMGQFIGRETKYSSFNLFQNIREIYQEQGIGGFFNGMMPRWLAEVLVVVITNFMIHFLRNQIPAQEMVGLYEYMASLSAQTLTYPLNVVSTVMAVNNSGIRAGTMPITLTYGNWQDAYNDLTLKELSKRGSGLFNRMVPTSKLVLPQAQFYPKA